MAGGGGAALVDGVRRWFRRRGPVSSEPALSSSSASSSLTSAGPDCVETVEGPGLVALPAIRVPKNKMPPPLDDQLEKG